MNSNSITSLAILKANWDLRHKDYLDNFLPFFENLIREKKYATVEVEEIKNDFKNEYGLLIPYHPLRAIINRLIKKGVLFKKEYKLFVNQEKINNSNFDTISQEQSRKLNKLVSSLISYAKIEHSFAFDEQSAEEALLVFFKKNEIGILFATTVGSALPDLELNKSAHYIVARFIQNSKDKEPDLFTFLVDLAVGAALAATLMYGEDLQLFSGRSKGLNLYLDSGYIFSLLGANGEEKKDAFHELTATLSGEGASLFMFEHTYDEVMGIFHNALYWMKNNDYDISKASRVLRYFINAELSESDVDIFINQVPSFLAKFKISIIQKPDYKEKIQYQIGEEELKKQIVIAYQLDHEEEYLKGDTINKDIDSIYSIFKLRKGRVAFSLKDASHVFVTTNNTLAKISRNVQNEDGGQFGIPPCVTDVFLGTIVWLQSPSKTAVINQKKLIADAYAAVQPDTILIKKYLDEINALKKKEEISEEECLLLRTSVVARNLLTEKTTNDSNNFVATTPKEILFEMTENQVKELRKEVTDSKEKNIQMSDEIDSIKKELEITNEKVMVHKKRNEKIISFTTGLITYAILPLLIGVIVFFSATIFPGVLNLVPEKMRVWVQIIAWGILTAFALFGISVLDIKEYVSKLVRRQLLKMQE
jgi:hypothetical protein